MLCYECNSFLQFTRMYDTVGSVKMSASVCWQPENTADFSENYPIPLKGVQTSMSIFMTAYDNPSQMNLC